MGYSIGVRARSKTLQRQMLDFLQANYRAWYEVVGGHNPEDTSSPTDDADYDDAKTFVGFNYSSTWGWNRFWTTTICRWIALQVGRRRRSFAKDVITPNVLAEPTPFITYDGYQNWPVIVSTAPKRLPKGQQWCSTDNLGLPNGPDVFKDYAHVAAEMASSPDETPKTKAAWDRFMREVDKLDLDEREANGKITRDQRLDERRTLMAECFKPIMVETFSRMRTELQRLQDLWLLNGQG